MVIVNFVYDRLYDKFDQQRLYVCLLAVAIGFLVIGSVIDVWLPFISSYMRSDRILLYQPTHYTVLVDVIVALIIWLLF